MKRIYHADRWMGRVWRWRNEEVLVLMNIYTLIRRTSFSPKKQLSNKVIFFFSFFIPIQIFSIWFSHKRNVNQFINEFIELLMWIFLIIYRNYHWLKAINDSSKYWPMTRSSHDQTTSHKANRKLLEAN